MPGNLRPWRCAHGTDQLHVDYSIGRRNLAALVVFGILLQAGENYAPLQSKLE